MKIDEKIKNNFKSILHARGIFDLAEKLSNKFSAKGLPAIASKTLQAGRSASGGKTAEVFLVGGAVRDIILGRPVKDIDILVRGVKITDLEKELKKLGQVNLVGKRFGVLKFISKAAGLPRSSGGRNDSNSIDIALPRTDFSFGTGGYKDFEVKSNPDLPLKDDLVRRDFTINAMAWDIYNSRLVDDFGGMADLKKKIIRTVGQPKDRFGEDYSRMLRAIRFAVQLGFEIEKNTWATIKKSIGSVNWLAEDGERKVPHEVVASEFLKGFSAGPARAILMHEECGALKYLMPEIANLRKCGQPEEFHSEGDVLAHTLLALRNLDAKMFKQYFPEPVSLTTKIAILLHDIGKPASKKKIDGRTVFYNHDKIGADIARRFLERLKMSAPPGVGVNIDEVVWLVENHLLFFYAPPEKMKKTTVEKYLFHKNFSGRAHLELFLADALATKPAKHPINLDRFKMAYKLWKSLQDKQTAVPPKSILNGGEIMKILRIVPGPKVGEVLNLLREEQLSGRIKDKKSAEQFVKKLS